jgi:hypothetical protein
MAHPHKDQAKASRHAKVDSMHSDAPQDRAMIQAAIARHEAKHHAHMPHRAHGGRVPMTAGADSGVGRLQKTTRAVRKS